MNFSTLRITNWNGLVEATHVTGVTEKPGHYIAFDLRDPDTGVLLRDDDRRPRRGVFKLRGDQAGEQTCKKIEVLNPAGIVIETHLGELPIEDPEPAARAGKPAGESKAKSK